MSEWTVEKIDEFYTYLNEYFGLLVKPKIEVGEKNCLPVQWHKGKFLFIPKFFNDDEISEDVRMNLLLLMYAYFYQVKHNDNHLAMNPLFIRKGICNELGIMFLTDEQIESSLRKVRRKLYDEIEYCSYFKVGYELRESAFTSYKVTKIERKENDILVTVKPIGCKLGNPEKVFAEEELFKRCCIVDFFDNVKVDMRKNLVIISGPSGVGKTTVVKELMKQYPELNKTVSLTTRKPRSNEVDGKDYYFISKDEFYNYKLNNEMLEDTIYNGELYGTLISEISKYPEYKPLILVIDTNGRRKVLAHFPLSTTIFIQAPSTEELRKRIEDRGENTEDEIEERIKIATEEMKEARYYERIVVNDDIGKCVRETKNIITRRFPF